MSALEQFGKVGSISKNVKRFVNDPIGVITDGIIYVIAILFIPIPYAGDVLIELKHIIIPVVVAFVLIPIVSIGLIMQVVLIPIVAAHGIKTTIITYINKIISGGGTEGGVSTSPTTNPLNGYREGGYSDTNTPTRNPFGGGGYSWTTITATFMDPSYGFFNGVHTGLDLVPNTNYYQNSGAYKISQKPIVLATISGWCMFYTDVFGALVVEVISSDNTTKTVYMHLAQSFVKTGDIITAGQPVGVMGSTGFSTGMHLHYEVRRKIGVLWVPLNPAGFIN